MSEIITVVGSIMSILVVFYFIYIRIFQRMRNRDENRLGQELVRLIDETTGEVDVKKAIGFIYVSIDEAKYDIKTVLYVLLAILIVSAIGQGISIISGS